MKVFINDVQRTVESNVAIICSSMPACASFIKETLLNSNYVTFFKSRLVSLRKRYGSKTASDFKLNDSQSIQAERPNLELTSRGKFNDHVRLEDNLCLNPNNHISNYEIEVFSEPQSGDVEAGVIKKSVCREISYQEKAH